MSLKLSYLQRGLLLASAVAPYLTAKKLLNFFLIEMEAWRRATHPQGFPYIAIIDSASACNLRCPYCPTGAGRDSGRRRKLIEISTIQRLLEEYGNYLISANMYNWGEPLLHPQVEGIIQLFHQRLIFTSICTNLNILNKEILQAVCDSGLDHLVISISGASQEVYNIYHRRGDYHLVMDNIKFLTAYKRRRHLKKPLIEIKYLTFKFNQAEVETARRQATALGVDLFRAVPAGGPETVTMPGADRARQTPLFAIKHCHQLWHAIVLNADGGVSPCCYTYFKSDDFGDFSQGCLEDLRRNERFVTARHLFNPRLVERLPPDLRHPCLKCPLTHEQPHLQQYLESNPNAVRGHRTGGP